MALDATVRVVLACAAAHAWVAGAAAAAAPQRGPHDDEQAVTCVAVLPEGRLLAGGPDGRIRAHDLESGRPLAGGAAVFARHAAAVIDLDVDPRGELVSASSMDGRVALWALRGGGVVPRLEYPGDFGEPVAVLTPTPQRWRGAVEVEWTPDGAHLVTWSFDWLHGPSPTTVQVWTREGALVWTGPHARYVDVHPERRAIAAVLTDEVLLGWPGEGVKSIALPGASDCVEFSPDGARLVVGGRGFGMWILDAATGDVLVHRAVTEVDPWGVHEWIHRAHWSPDGKQLGVVAGKGLNPGIVLAEDLSAVWAGGFFGGQMWRIYDVAWTPHNELAVSFGNVSLVDPTKKTLRGLVERGHLQTLVAVPGSQDVVLLAGGTVRRVDPASGKVRWTQ